MRLLAQTRNLEIPGSLVSLAPTDVQLHIGE
jgi:hypothetical protein